ncbi:hypothetical protein [Synechococcus phage S-H9-2]|uniref:Uncharacterized protein n=1 Tax=Synechococcus phage S-H9-2 TaxID=2783669 RepID=A0A873WAP6_9CAUD|nr:hypothetical protein PQC10_gp020 [Synechococcus phage S-H9-2]QPB08297.1 hypothetical protein [Synechococcus phage S-H9-2]
MSGILRVDEIQTNSGSPYLVSNGSTTTFKTSLDFQSGSNLTMPSWTTANRPTTGVAVGTSGFNTTEGELEIYNGTEWTPVSGGSSEVIDRGDPANLSNGFLLEDFNVVHYFQSSNNDVNIDSQLVENAVYEMTYTSSGGSANIDFYLRPNGVNHGSEFRSHYRATDGSANFNRADQTLSFFYFDHFFGGSGSDPMGKVWFTTGPTNKYMYYVGSDTASLSIGYCRWTNNSRNWNTVGFTGFNGNNKRFWVRRIG